MSEMEHATPQGRDVHEPLATAREAAAALNLPMNYLIRASERQRLDLPHHFVGSRLRFRLSELRAWMEAHDEHKDNETNA